MQSFLGMRLPGVILSLVLLVVPTYVLCDPSYFIINDLGEWSNGKVNYASWIQGAGQGIDTFDVELARLSSDGLYFVALNVPSNAPSLAINLEDVLPGDDYFLLFLNTTHGAMYAMSQRFSILSADQAPSNSSSTKPPPAKKGQPILPTLSVSGSPSPTSTFAYTFAPTSGAREARTMRRMGTMLAGLFAVLWTMWWL